MGRAYCHFEPSEKSPGRRCLPVRNILPSPSGRVAEGEDCSNTPRRCALATGTLLLFACLILVSVAAQAQTVVSADSPFDTVLVLAALGLLPFAFMTATSFVKLSVVFYILRNALGTGQVPSGAIITALAALLSLTVMAPVGVEMMQASQADRARIDARDPLSPRSVPALLASISSGAEPLRRFLQRNAGEREVDLFVDLGRKQPSAGQGYRPGKDDLLVVLPAFLLTELGEAFQIGFLVFLPFLIIDMVVANVLLSLGMHMLSPTSISLPFKLLLFVLVDGFTLLTRALLLGYH